MYKKLSIMIVVALTLLLGSTAQAGRDITGPFDVVIGVPTDGVTTGGNDNGWPPNELPPFAVDDQILTKYLHFKGNVEPTGIRITPAAGPTVVTGLTFTTANDADPRDPVEWELSGSNVSIDGPYTLIASGPIVDFAGSTAWPRRTKTTTPITFANNVSYAHYQLMFPAIRNAGSANSMQIAEVELLMAVYKADEPVPGDGTMYDNSWANLAWTPGEAAVSHDVYLGENFDDVDGGDPNTFLGNYTTPSVLIGFFGFPVPDGLVRGKTYYWRVDEVNPAKPDSPWKGDVWSFTVTPEKAWMPNPRDTEKFVKTDASLSWGTGAGAKLHTVYFGDNFDDVSNASGGTLQPLASFKPGTLEMNKTYYWRVDELNPPITHKGDVWSFTTTDGGGGVKGEYFNNTSVVGSPVLTRIDPDVNINLADTTSPGAPVNGDGWSARWTADLDIVFTDTYTFSVNSQDGTRLWIDDKLVIDVWVAWVTTKYASVPIRLDKGIHSLRLEYFDSGGTAVQQLYWSTPTMTERIIPAGPLQPPFLARRPVPLDGTVGVNLMSQLTWKAGHAAVSHDVYFGSDPDAVANATKASPEYKGNKALGSESLDPGKLDFNTAYYWRVDEVNDTNPNSPWVGNVWTLDTGNMLVVDDFESYNDTDLPDPASNTIFGSWVDGYGVATNGALTAEELPPYAELGEVHTGLQGMKYRYDTNLMICESTLTVTYPKDWTEQGMTKLSLWFLGDATNQAERMFVALNGAAVVYHPDPAPTRKIVWTEWVIDLQGFANQGAVLTGVNTLTIGFGTKGAPAAGSAGTVYFDDIRLLP